MHCRDLSCCLPALQTGCSLVHLLLALSLQRYAGGDAVLLHSCQLPPLLPVVALSPQRPSLSSCPCCQEHLHFFLPGFTCTASLMLYTPILPSSPIFCILMSKSPKCLLCLLLAYMSHTLLVVLYLQCVRTPPACPSKPIQVQTKRTSICCIVPILSCRDGGHLKSFIFVLLGF